MKLMSWNVNGLRAVVKKGFTDQIETLAPDVLGLQETKPKTTRCEKRCLGGTYEVFSKFRGEKGLFGDRNPDQTTTPERAGRHRRERAGPERPSVACRIQ